MLKVNFCLPFATLAVGALLAVAPAGARTAHHAAVPHPAVHHAAVSHAGPLVVAAPKPVHVARRVCTHKPCEVKGRAARGGGEPLS